MNIPFLTIMLQQVHLILPLLLFYLYFLTSDHTYPFIFYCTPLTTTPAQNSFHNTPPAQKSSLDTSPTQYSTTASTPPPTPLSNLNLRRSQRACRPPNYLQEYHFTLVSSSAPPHSFSNYQLAHYLSYDHLSTNHRHFSLNVSFPSKPQTQQDAVIHECWREAINLELLALEQNGTLLLIPLLTGKKAVGCKWIFKVKFQLDGSVKRHKPCLVAKGYTQTQVIDYMDTFSPMVKMTTLHVLLALAVAKVWFLHQLNINIAFLHGNLHEEVYMNVPLGLTDAQLGMVCKLQRSLYGLKQASRQWNAKLTSGLTSSSFIQPKADYSLFIKHSTTGFTTILVYVDDLVLAGNDLHETTTIKTLLDTRFKIKDLGNLKYFLGMKVARSAHGITLYQQKYTLDLLQDYSMLGAKLVSTPMDYTLKLSTNSRSPLLDSSVYRRLVGKLFYLGNTIPHIAYVPHKFIFKLLIEYFNILRVAQLMVSSFLLLQIIN